MEENLRKSYSGILIIMIMSCLFMGFTDAIWQPGYGIKSTLKIITFLFVPFYYGGVNKNIKLKSLFVFRRKGMIHGILMGVGVYAFILACYFTIGTFFDFSRVTEALNENMGVTRENFIFVAIYISFVNSLLEEFFFRGFIFMNLKRLGGRKSAYWISATAFGLYHIAMMRGWFSFWLFILLLMSLVGAGIFFDWLNEKQENIYNSWFVHMSANFSINTVGFILFGIL